MSPGHVLKGPHVKELLSALIEEAETELKALQVVAPGPPRPSRRRLQLAYDRGRIQLRMHPFHDPMGTSVTLYDNGEVRLDPNTWPNRVHLSDPRCITDFARMVLRLVEAHHVEQLTRAESTDDQVLLQRTIALRAFLLGFDAIRDGQRDAAIRLAEECLTLLECEDPEQPGTIVRKMTYTLVSATCQPGEAAVEQRAKELGLGFLRFGGYSPYLPWHRIVRAVRAASHSPRTRLRTGSDERVASELRSEADQASRIEPHQLRQLHYVLRHTSLSDMAKHHRLL